MRWVIPFAIASAFVATLVPAATAQPVPNNGPMGNPAVGPAYSPYLNLLRRGNSAGANYFGLVRPELEFRSAYRGLQQQANTNQLNMAQNNDPVTGLPFTGHTAVFLNTGGYFMNNGTQGRPGAAGARQTPGQQGAAPAGRGAQGAKPRAN